MHEDSPLSLTGGGRGLLAAAGADERLTGARPALVTGETFAVLPVDADWWSARLGELASSARRMARSRPACAASRQARS